MFLSQIFQSASDKAPSGNTSDSWLSRHEDKCFKESFSYCGVVECIQSRVAATIVIAQKKNGKPLMWHEVWDPKKDQLGRVLLLVSRLRSSINGEVYSKDTQIDTVLNEGDLVMVEIKYSSASPDNLYHYFASSAYKNTGSFPNLERIRNPLRGIVDSLAADGAAVVRFGSYTGSIARCALTIHNLYYKGEKVKRNLPMGAVINIGSEIYLEVTKWNPPEFKQEWEKLLYKDGVIFRASKAWMKGDPRPSRHENTPQLGFNVNQSKDKKCAPSMKQKGDAGTRSSENENARGSLTNLQAYYGIVESINSSSSAVICTAIRNGEPLTWKENWLTRGVIIERALLLVDHIRPSKTQPEYSKGSDIRKILNVGEKLMIVADLSEKKPDSCYKWFVRTSWKVEEEEKGSCTFVEHLPGHLHGVVDCVLTHSIGIIAFRTYHGTPAKAFFTHNNFYQNGEKILDHLPLGSEVSKGTEVFLVAERWHPGRTPNQTDKEMMDKHVRFRAVLAWRKGSPKPNEECTSKAKRGRASHHGEKHGSSSDGRRSEKRNEGTRGRGRRRGGRGRERRGRTGTDSGKDSVSNYSSDSDFSDISSVSDHFGAMKVEVDKSVGFDAFSQDSNPSISGVDGTIISIDDDWGLVQINDDEVKDFQPNHVILYGLKLINVPLSKLFRQGQVVKVHSRGGKVSMVEYGAPQLPILMRKAVMTYCEKNAVHQDVIDILEKTMQSYGV